MTLFSEGLFGAGLFGGLPGRLYRLSRPVYREGGTIEVIFAKTGTNDPLFDYPIYVYLRTLTGDWINFLTTKYATNNRSYFGITNAELYDKNAGFYLELRHPDIPIFFANGIKTVDESIAQSNTFAFSEYSVPHDTFDPTNITTVDIILKSEAGSWTNFVMTPDSGGWVKSLILPDDFVPDEDAGYIYKLTDNQSHIIYLGQNGVALTDIEALDNPFAYYVYIDKGEDSFYANAATLQILQNLEAINVIFSLNIITTKKNTSGVVTYDLNIESISNGNWDYTFKSIYTPYSGGGGGSGPTTGHSIVLYTVITQEGGITLFYISNGIAYLTEEEAAANGITIDQTPIGLINRGIIRSKEITVPYIDPYEVILDRPILRDTLVIPGFEEVSIGRELRVNQFSIDYVNSLYVVRFSVENKGQTFGYQYKDFGDIVLARHMDGGKEYSRVINNGQTISLTHNRERQFIYIQVVEEDTQYDITEEMYIEANIKNIVTIKNTSLPSGTFLIKVI